MIERKKARLAPLLAGALLTGWSCLAPTGCVMPEQIEPGLLTRYQQAIQSHPRSRAGDQGLDLLRPEAPAEALTAGEDAQTGRTAVELSLEQAVRLALRGSMDIRVVGYDPGISREEMVKAAAAFDFLVFAGVSHTQTDRRSTSEFFPTNEKVLPIQAGVREHAPTGTDWELSWTFTRTTDKSPVTVPEPYYESILGVKVVHPLLRNGGTDFNLARLRIAALGTKVAYAQFRQKVEEIVTQVHVNYWALVQARRELQIQKELLDKTIETHRRVQARKDLDATEVEVKQAEAAVEARRAGLVRARKTVFDAQDQLVRLLSDSRLNLLGEYAVVPTTVPTASEMTVDSTDQLVTALRYSPLLEQARLAVATADIQITLAKNQTLPVLNLTASAGIQGLRGDGGRAVDEMFRFDYIDHSIGVALEYPIGNRAAQADLRQARLQRLKAITEMQNLADAVALRVNEAIRQIQTTYEELKAQRASKEASRIQLQALEDTERIRGRLTPEFLQVKLQAQEALAAAERAESLALVSFNNAVAQLRQVTGAVLQEHNIQLAAESVITTGGAAPWPDTTVGPTSTPATTAPR